MAKKEERINKIIKLIEFFEKARALRISNPQEFETIWKDVRSIGGSRKDLKAIKKAFDKVITRVKSFEKTKKLVKITSILEIASFCLLAAILIIFITVYLAKLLLPIYFFLGAATAMIILPPMFFIMRWYTERKLRETYSQHSIEFKNIEIRIREIVQKYIFLLSKEIRRSAEDPSKFRFKLCHDDYKGVKIIQKPGAVSPFYMAVVEIESKN